MAFIEFNLKKKPISIKPKQMPLKGTKPSIKKKRFFSKLKNFYLKKKFQIKKRFRKKKLSVVLNIFCLGSRSIFYVLRRKLIKFALKFQTVRNFLKLKVRLKHLNLMPHDAFFGHINFKEEPQNLDKSQDSSEPVVKPLKLKFFLTITVHANNIFINLAAYDKKKMKTTKFWSAGMFDFVCSKQKLKFALSTMLKIIKFKLKRLKIYTIKIDAPKYLNKHIYKQLTRLQYKPAFYIYSSFKIFNGCRSKKKRRKKRLRFRNFR